MRRASSSRKDQLDAPLMGPASYQGGLHSPNDRFGPSAQHGLALPREVVTEEPDRLNLVLPRQEPQCREPSEWTRAEQIAPVVSQPVLRQEPAAGQAEHHSPAKDPRS